MLARKSTLIVLNSIVGGILGFVALKVVALYMEAGIYGQFAFALSLVGTVTFLGNLGFTKAHTKRVSEGHELGDCISTFAAWNLGVGALYITIVLGALVVNEFFVHKPFVSTTETTLLLVTVAEASKYVRRVARGTFEARLEAARSELTILSEHLIRTPLMILVALLFASSKDRQGPIFEWLRDVSPGLADLVGSYGPEALAFAVFASALGSMVVGLFLLFRHFQPGEFRYDLLKSYTSFGLPVVAASSMNSLQTHGDKAMLGFFWSDQATGRYYGVQRILDFFTVIYNAVGAMLFPLISEYHSNGNREGVRQLVHKALRYISMVTVPAAFGAAALAEPIIRLMLSNDWLAAKTILAVMAFQLPFKGITTTLTHLQYGTDQPKLAAGLSIVNSATNIGLGLLLIPAALFGLPLAGMAGLGAAIGTLAAYVLDVGLRGWASRRFIDPGLFGHVARHWLAGGLMGLAVLGLQAEWLPLVRWFHFPLVVLGGALVYFAILWILREFTRTDVEFFWAAVHPGDMGRYIRDELAPSITGEDEEDSAVDDEVEESDNERGPG